MTATKVNVFSTRLVPNYSFDTLDLDERQIATNIFNLLLFIFYVLAYVTM